MKELYKETKWLNFFITERKPKTVVIRVYNTKDAFMGIISWLPTWRQYIYFPSSNLMFNNTCLDAISEVLTELNTKQREQRGKKK